ncbi:hypothetical protein [Sphaerisporangium fuscum]|uniref:hypothetical protein n=1 Tax=Sphaerisporangium fuscum TaxID=2835868 RepID=UPI001BDC748E|nr:hypothetical protein [Sphaerisporangium fuscum]
MPLGADVWLYLAFDDDRRHLPVSGGLPDEVYRDDPPPRLPFDAFRPDVDVFLMTLARLPEVRRPWLRAIYDQVREHRYSHPF